MTMGLISGIGLPFVEELNYTLLIIIILIFIASSIGIYFIRETKEERELFNLFSEIYPE